MSLVSTSLKLSYFNIKISRGWISRKNIPFSAFWAPETCYSNNNNNNNNRLWNTGIEDYPKNEVINIPPNYIFWFEPRTKQREIFWSDERLKEKKIRKSSRLSL